MEEDLNVKFEKKVVKFTKKVAKTGRAYCFYIPSSFIKNGLIDPTKTYTVFLSPVKDEQEES